MVGLLTLADLLPPDIFNSAGTKAVNTLDLVSSNDGILESTSLLDDEDGIILSALDLAGAFNTAAVGLHASIKGLAGSNLIRLTECLATLRLREWKAIALGESPKGCRGKQGEEKAFLDHGDGPLPRSKWKRWSRGLIVTTSDRRHLMTYISKLRTTRGLIDGFTWWKYSHLLGMFRSFLRCV